MSTVTTPGLRERKKAATRQSLHKAAVRLAAERGLDNLTVEAIADEAFVSRRTFSNYFASKEQALLHSGRMRIDLLIDIVSGRPEGEAPSTAILRAAEQLDAAQPEDPVGEEQWRKLRQHPALRAESAVMYAAAERDLAEAIADRLPDAPDKALRARVLSAAFLVVLRVAFEEVTDRGQGSLVGLTRQAFTIVSEGLR